MCLCVDYCQLNQVTKFDADTMPRIEELLDRIESAEFITTLNLARGYWQVPVKRGYQETSRKRGPVALPGSHSTAQDSSQPCLMDLMVTLTLHVDTTFGKKVSKENRAKFKLLLKCRELNPRNMYELS